MSERRNRLRSDQKKEIFNSDENTRIHKFLAQGGFGSRREIEKAIIEKKIYVKIGRAHV